VVEGKVTILELVTAFVSVSGLPPPVFRKCRLYIQKG